MSIIYDALKKVERHASQGREGNGGVQAQPLIIAKKRQLFLFFLVVCLGFVSAGLTYKYLLSSFASHPRVIKEEQQANVTLVSPAPVVIPEGAGKDILSSEGLSLNGIFFSGEESYALINNMIVKSGDTVDGWAVTEILMEEVELSKEGIKTRLRKK